MEGATWAAFSMAALSLLGNVAAAFNARTAARDKLEYELKTKELEVQARRFEDRLADLAADLADCREKHAHSERDRQEIHARAERAEREAASVRTELEALKLVVQQRQGGA
jgi:septal ring factor EnvC (AmiA/AmiB activator)